MATATGVRSPGSDAFWKDFEKRLRAVAEGICRGCKLALKSDPPDFVQAGLMIALKFMRDQTGQLDPPLEMLEAWREDALRYTRRGMKNAFLSEVRTALDWQHYCEENTPRPGEREQSSWGRDRVHTPEEYAIAASLAAKMRCASRSPKNQAIADAALAVATEGGDQVNGKDVTRRAGLSSRDLADFRRMITAKLGIRPCSTTDEV